MFYALFFGAVLVLLLRPGSRVRSDAMTLKEQIRDAIKKEIVEPLNLGLTAEDALYAHAVLETGDFKAKYFSMPGPAGEPPTWSMWNRHKGSGRGDWSGLVRYISKDDPDLRTFEDVYQCARDFRQLLTDPLYKGAYLALRANNPGSYFDALQAAGFSGTAKTTYAQSLKRTYESIV